MQMQGSATRDLLRRMFDAAIQSAQPAHCLAAHLPARPQGRTIIVGAGKAAAAMAQAVEIAWPDIARKGKGKGKADGLAVVPYGSALPTKNIEIRQAAHPVPDRKSVAAARHVMKLVRELTEDDLVLVLLSGGGSALWSLPGAGLELSDKQTVTAHLLRCGAPIDEINCVRKHLSAIKGGRLAAAAFPASVCTLAISDVPGDDPAVIASGPSVADPTSAQDAKRILTAHKIDVSGRVSAFLNSPAAETPKPEDPCFDRTTFQLIARPRQALNAAARIAQAAGYRPVILGDALEGEARHVARHMAAQALKRQTQRQPCVLLSGGEVTVTGAGGTSLGGPNRELALALAMALDGASNISALIADTDGRDGFCQPNQPIAGAVIDPSTMSRAVQWGLDSIALLKAHRSGDFFRVLGDEVVTGPTHTNVNDFRAILIAN